MTRCPECGGEHDDGCLIAELVAAIGQRKSVELLSAIRADATSGEVERHSRWVPGLMTRCACRLGSRPKTLQTPISSGVRPLRYPSGAAHQGRESEALPARLVKTRNQEPQQFCPWDTTHPVLGRSSRRSHRT
jgi:hypothetical protein